MAIFGQLPGRLIEKVPLNKNYLISTQYSTKEGLPQNQVNAIVALNNRALVLATTYGVVEFDGYLVKPVTNAGESKKVNFKTLLYSPLHNKVFGITFGGELFQISPSYKKITLNEPHRVINSAEIYGDTIYSITNHGILLKAPLSNLSFTEVAQTKCLNAQCIKYLYPYLYMGSESGLYQTNLHRKTTVKISEIPCLQLRINAFNNSFYGLGRDLVFKITENEITETFKFNGSAKNLQCRDFCFVGSDIFVAGRKGLFRCNQDTILNYSTDNLLPTNHLFSVCYDKEEDCLFVGTEEKGLLKIQLNNKIYSTDPDRTSPFSFISIVKTRSGNTLAAANCCRIYQITHSKIFAYSSIHGNFSTLAEINDTLCAGLWNLGIVLIKNRVPVDTIKLSGWRDNSVHALFKDSRGGIWVGASDGIACGLFLHHLFPALSEKVKGRIIDFYELRNGNICAFGENGVYILSGRKLLKTINESDGLNGKEVRSLYEDADGKLWIGTYGGGVYCYNNGKLTSVNSMRGCQLNKDAFCFAKDRFGMLYMSSNQGLWSVSEKDLNDFYDGKLGYLIPFHYNEEAGLINTEFNGGFRNNYHQRSNGDFYFPTIEGLIGVKAEPVKPRKLKPFIEQVLVNDTLVSNGMNVFGRNTNSVRINFSCVNFTQLYNVYFQHKLMGERSYDWSLPQKQNNVNLKLLPPGTYTFVVRAIDALNERKPFESTYTFQIRSLFYETLWFKIFAGLVLVVLLYFYYRWRINDQKRKTELKESYTRKLAEIELKAVQAQLNPHFLFNCMNTMKHFILERDYIKANDCLNRISYLVRNSLENSDKIFVSLNEKIKFITNYVELEKMRLGDNLAYEISYDQNISKDTPLPNFIIQPYVENAIKHGITNLESGNGFLSVRFFQDNSHLVCQITDNGIGRKASFQLNKNNFLHVSKGTELTKEKANFLKLYNKYECLINIEDLYDDNNQSAGTRVTIKIPLNYDHRNN